MNSQICIQYNKLKHKLSKLYLLQESPAIQRGWVQRISKVLSFQHKTLQDDHFQMDLLIAGQKLPLEHKRKTATKSLKGNNSWPKKYQ